MADKQTFDQKTENEEDFQPIPENKIKKELSNKSKRFSLFTNQMSDVQMSRIFKLRQYYDDRPDQIQEEKNRYQDILPYPHTMMVKNRYFNGNKIQLTDNIFIYMCQAPVDVKEFHDVIWETRPSHIIQVSPFIENGFPKVLRYVPICKGEDEQFTRGSLRAAQILLDANMIQACKIQNNINLQKNESDNQKQVRFEFENKEIITYQGVHVQSSLISPNNKYDPNMVRINLIYRKQKSNSQEQQGPVENDDQTPDHHKNQKIENSQEQKTKQQDNTEELIIPYVYMKNWTDCSAPRNIEHICDLCEMIKSPNNVLIHCSAGVGRSGTLAVCMYIYDYIVRKKQPFKDMQPTIFEAVEILRTKRNPVCVQTFEQFEFLFSFAEHCINLAQKQQK